jgi:hypothetical protein
MSTLSQRLENPLTVNGPVARPEGPARLETRIQIVRPDLSGKWNLNKTRSSWSRESAPERLKDVSWIMVIEQKLPAISITVKAQRGVADNENFFGGRFTLYSDGRGDEYPVDGSIEISTTKWVGDKLVTTHYDSDGSRMDVRSIKEFELSPDGKTLTHTEKYMNAVLNEKHEVVTVVNDKRTVRMVYDRVN